MYKIVTFTKLKIHKIYALKKTLRIQKIANLENYKKFPP